MKARRISRLLLLLMAGGIGLSAYAQVIEFESGGLKYKTLTRRGVTIMFAHLPPQVRGYSAIQVAISNGSQDPVSIGPEQFSYRMPDGPLFRGGDAETVITSLIEKANRDDVIKLVTAYEMGLYGIVRFRSTNGYERRRQSALAEVTSTRLKAAAAASAVVLVGEQLRPGASTDGIVFFYTAGRPLAAGTLIAEAVNEEFDFEPDEEPSTPVKQLRER